MECSLVLQNCKADWVYAVAPVNYSESDFGLSKQLNVISAKCKDYSFITESQYETVYKKYKVCIDLSKMRFLYFSDSFASEQFNFDEQIDSIYWQKMVTLETDLG